MYNRMKMMKMSFPLVRAQADLPRRIGNPSAMLDLSSTSEDKSQHDKEGILT